MKKDKKEASDDSSKIKKVNKNLRKSSDEAAGSAGSGFIKKTGTAFANVDIKRFAVAAAVILSVIIVLGFVMPASANAKYTDAYEVYINDAPIGVMEDVAGLETLLDYFYTEYEAYYDMEVSKDMGLSYAPVKIDEQFLCPSSYYEEIFRDNFKVNVVAWVIYVNNCPVTALRKREDAQWVLEQILEPYKNDAEAENRFDIGFLENVEIKSEVIDFDMVEDKETALKIIQYGDDMEVRLHKVVSGESLYSICKSYGLKLSDIRKANPTLPKDGKIYKGDVLIVTKINNVVNVVYTEYTERTEEMSYESVILWDEHMYETQTRVQQSGMTGLRNIKANVVYINGSEASYEILTAAAPSRESIDEILIKGTIPVPAVLKLASTGQMPLPLSNYNITSYFGVRNTGIDGASTFHNGVDLAAPHGTPIYASAEGKVTFAGSSSGYGLLIKIKHDGGVETRYGHCSTLLVKSGQYVKKGEIIGLVGSTGVSSGNHVHFEVRINGSPVDPLG